MSSTAGEIIKEKEVKGYFRYCGTTSVAISAIYDNEKELSKHWEADTWNKCTCGQPSEEVLLYTRYGGGFYWPAKVCFKCRAITENPMPYELPDELQWENINPISGMPRGGYKWPKDGHPLRIRVKITWEYVGETGEYIDEGNYDTFENALFQWKEGNFSCDCNRSRFFGLTEKYPERCEESVLSKYGGPDQKEERDEWDFPCGKTIKVLSIEQI